MKRIKVFFLILLLAREAHSAELFEYNIPIRARGMGMVYTAFPDPVDAVLVNPAYLAFAGEIGWEFFNIGVGVNGLQAMTDFADVSSYTSISDYNNLFGKRLWLSGTARSNLVLPFWGFSYFNESKMKLFMDNPMFPSFNMEFYNDSGFQFGFGLPIGPFMSFGLGIKRIRRWGGIESVGVSTLTNGVGSLTAAFEDTGTGYGLDPAIQLQLPLPLTPMIAAVWKDMGSTQFNIENGTDNPPRIKDNLIFSGGILLDLPGMDVRTGMEYRHVNTTGEQIGKKLHFGSEVSLPLVDLRAGLSQGYQSFGLGINLFIFKLDAAMYTVELGDYPGQLPEERIEASLSFQMSFDADFSFNGKDGGKDGKGGYGKRRKLKQRR